MTTLGKYLKTLRKSAGFSLSEAASKANMTKPHIWELEDGRANNPTARTIFCLARAYSVDPMSIAAAAFADYRARKPL